MTLVYVIRDSGILVCSASDEDEGDDDDCVKHDLNSSLLSGITQGINATFMSNVDHFVLINKRVVYYKNFKINGNEFYVIVLTGSKNGINIRSKMVELKIFLEEKNRWKVLESYKTESSYSDIKEKIKTLFLK